MLARSLPSSLVIHPVIPFVRPNPGLPCKRHRLRLRLGVRAHADLLLNPLVAPALAAATAAVALTLLAPRRRAVPEAEGGDIAGTWILYTSPTPFNRCVLLRCPSVSFEDGGQLLRRDRHYVNLSRGCIPVSDKEEEEEEEDGGLSYQRVCVGTADGGVISLDWPHHLDLDKEHGLDTTLLLVPGSTDGSMDRSVRMLVHDALNHGYFPIVMNPRGCAGSPLTTARLFSAGDSDDVSVAAQFINRVRPWTTMMSVAWGFGANMLTKYLAEVGEATPLTAAVCINNPFDLDEATRSFPHHIAVDQKLTSGLIDILRANKELFQGKAKGFDVTKGLSATSVRDFDGAVSMISNGFATIEDFYTNSSTRQSVSDLKIPVLYIQSDDGTVPLFSIPRSSISENPFTSLLLCSCFPSTTITGERSAILWCQHLAIEWLSAVELALLKGRHPLLKDVDITVNPSKGLTLVEDRAVAKSISSEIEDDHLKLTQSNLANGFLASPSTNVFIENDTAARSELNRGRQFHWEHREEVVLEQEKSSNLSEQNGTVNDIPAKRDTEIDSEQSQVLQTASAVMNMLDVTMPGTLDDEQKKKVLTAMEQGETLMKALQGAVPEDVRGKLTTAVTDILQTQGTKVNLDGVRRIGWIPNVASNLKSKIRKSGDDNASDKVQSDAGEGKPQDDSALRNPDSNNTQESINSSQQQATKASENIEADSEMGVKQTQPKKFEKASGEAVDSVAELSNANLSELSNANQGHGESVRHSMDDQAVENDTSIRETKKIDSEAEECMPIPSNNEKAFAAGSPNSDHTVEKSENEVLKNDDQISQDPVDQKSQAPLTKLEEPSPPSSKPTSMSVTQALDALTGFDDSTQMAVNSVFGVIENMIDQLEKASNLDKNEEKDEAENQESVTESHDSSINRDKTENIDDRKNELNLGSDVIQSSNKGENNLHVEDAEYHEEVEKRGGNRVLDGLKSSEKTGISPCTENNAAIKELSKGNINKVARLQNFPIGVGINPYWQLPHQTYFRRYFSTQLRGIQPSDSNSTTDLVLDPKEGRWRMLDQSGHTEDIKGENQQIQSREDINFSLRYSDRNGIIEPSYVILDTEYPEPGYSTDKGHEKICSSKKINNAEIEVIYMIKNKILDALKIEVGRRLGLPKLEEIESNLVYELELVADSVSQVIVCDNELNLNSFSEASDSVPMKLRADRGERIIKAIYSAVQEASYLRKVLPIGVIVGSSLASLRKYFQVTAPHADDQINASVSNSESIQEGLNCQELGNKYKLYVDEKNQHGDSDKLLGGCDEKIKTPDSNSDGIMVGAVTAALGASALLTHHQQKINKSEEIPPDHFNNNAFPHDEKIKNEEAVLEKSQSSLVSSLAEKAMSVAGPVVPTKSDGAVDHERLVAILAELGQKGGMLRLIGKFALLWGGIRGAMSLTDKLISFLHIAERPLFQRLLGFVCMVLLLWSPVVIPLLPTLVQSWTTKISNGFAECSCIIGLYVATTILVILWGKRIRGYDDPLDQYGLHLTLVPAVHHFLKGLLGGVMIILFIHSINALLGYASLSSSSGLPSSTSMVMLLKMYGSLLLLAVRGMVSATGIALVEELLFRSWFLEEVAVDLGYSRAIIVSALAFSLAQRSLHSVPGFLLLSLALFGIKQRAHEKLYAPIGIRTGIMTANFVLHHSHLLKYQSRTPFWLTSTHLWHPFDGVVGLSICGVLAVLFFPIRPLQKNKVSDSHS